MPGSPPRPTASARLPIAVAVAAGTVATLAAILPASESLRQATALAVYLIAPIAVILGMRRFRPPARRAWAAIAAYAAVSALASAALSTFASVDPGTPAFGDAIRLPADLVLLAALAAALTARERRQAVAVDVAAIAASMGLVLGTLMFARYEGYGIAELTSSLYLVVDLALLSCAARLALAPRPQPLATRLLTVSVVGLVVSDGLCQWLLAGIAYTPGAWGDVGWIVQSTLIAVAASHPSMIDVARRVEPAEAQLRLPSAVAFGIASLAAPVLLALENLGAIPAMSSVGVAAMLAGGGVVALGIVAHSVRLIRGSQTLAVQLEATLDERGRRLDASQQRYRKLVEQLPGIVYIIAPGATPGEFAGRYVSPQIEPMLGITQQAWLADMSCFLEVVHAQDRASVLAHMREIGLGARLDEFEFRVVDPCGRTRWMRNTYAFLRDATGPTVVQGMMVDVTSDYEALAERDRMEADLRLAQKLESVGQLAAGIAHEINTPIQFVGDTVHFLDDAFTDLMELVAAYERLHEAVPCEAVAPDVRDAVAAAYEIAEPDYLRERVPAAFARAFDGVGRVSKIVRAMREFGLPPTTERVPVDVNAAIETTLVVAANEYKYVADVTRELAEVPTVLGNAGDLNQVLLNLVVNAAHAIEERVRDSGQRGTIAIATLQDGGDVVIRVSDDGCGMPPDVATRAFDPFFTTKEVGRGTGQGLAIIRQAIIQHHGGTITFDSEPGRGTTFEVRLPVGGRADAVGAPGEEVATA